ncbi:DUF6291 domain-containing protein [Chryseobacterium sp. Ch-15]|uniref:DUF6291 domain-containing protein n=1 Tax=Chryseobacterium muglaense TaxID=2893752 RepID=A0A9Q3UQF6_9FLAO|nr:DUF6291 domain-containing protein [Chryseobacterium muglaense]MBD3904450.1 HNH endonuclease [Chryseobacterium muglaense]MCC9032732.1 DUF6291 domain-containing protein [Chryseobacterium muglaense]MCM2554211.1 DUF6291 domain-containing protein [Chryseobacterium muglaense]
MAEKIAFVLYKIWLKPVQELSVSDAGKLFKAVLQFANNEEPEIEEPFEALYLSITEQIVFEWSKYNPKTGKYHWNYKGGISAENHIIRNSTEIKIWRSKVFTRDKFTCQHCCNIGGELNAHHVKTFAEFPDLRFEVSNGLTLCKECHITEHKRIRNEE